jgi:hypothetical protein
VPWVIARFRKQQQKDNIHGLAVDGVEVDGVAEARE